MRLKTTLGEIEEHLHSQNLNGTIEVDAEKTDEVISETADNRLNQKKVSTRKKNRRQEQSFEKCYSFSCKLQKPERSSATVIAC